MHDKPATDNWPLATDRATSWPRPVAGGPDVATEFRIDDPGWPYRALEGSRFILALRQPLEEPGDPRAASRRAPDEVVHERPGFRVEGVSRLGVPDFCRAGGGHELLHGDERA